MAAAARPVGSLVPRLLFLALSGVVALVAVEGSFRAVRAGPAEEGQGSGEQGLPSPRELAAQVDRLLAAGWQEAGVEPAAAADDAEWLRRLSLDLNGVIPSEELTRGFLASSEPDKRARLVKQLLDDPAFARSMGLRWAYLLVGRDYLIRARAMEQQAARRGAMRRMTGDGESEGDARVGEAGGGGETMAGGGGGAVEAPLPDEARSLPEWLAAQLAQGASWREVARELIAAEGTVVDNPATQYVFRHFREGRAEELTGSAMRVFQGLQIQCAQCHDHPYEAWSQRDFYGVAAFFARTRTRRLPPTAEQLAMAERRGLDEKERRRLRGPYAVDDGGRGQIRIPAEPGRVGALVLPRFLNGKVINPAAGVDRRAALAELVTADDNPWFAKATVNRVWSFFFERGLVNPVDDLGAVKETPPALALLADDFQASGYDMRRLVETIVSTRAYGLSSAGPLAVRDAQLEVFARAPLRRLGAEQLFYSVLEATGAADVRTGERRARLRLERRKNQLLRQFVTTFGDDEGEEVVEEGTIPQALMRFNGALTNEAVRPRPGHPVYDRLFRTASLDERIDTIYLRVLSRFPGEVERTKLRALLGPRPAAELAQAYADVFWALLNGAEFNFNH